MHVHRAFLDEYMIAPHLIEQLRAAMHALRMRHEEVQQTEFGRTEVVLTTTEFDLLAFLLRRPGRVYEREHLLSEVWGYAAAAGTRTVDVHVAQLRAKLGDASPIRTVRGVGYSAESP